MRDEEKLTHLFYEKNDEIRKVRIDRENNVNFIVESRYKNQYEIVNKNTMKSATGVLYFTHPFLVKETYYIEQNASKIAKALEKCQNPFLLRQIAHNLEIEEQLKDINYSDELLKEKGEN